MAQNVKGFSYVGLGLTNQEIENLQVRENAVTWHCSLTCVHCGQHMFWMPRFKRWFCRSWLYMEGGCGNQEEFLAIT